MSNVGTCLQQPQTSIYCPEKKTNKESNFCGFCLAMDIPLINLESCKHFLYYVRLILQFQEETLVGMSSVCHNCHSFLKKYRLFRIMVDNSQKLLKEKSVASNWRRKVLHQHTYSKIEHTDIIPNDFPIKTEATFKGEHSIEIELPTVKCEEDNQLSDFYNEMPSEDFDTEQNRLQTPENTAYNSSPKSNSFYNFNAIIDSNSPQFIEVDGLKLPTVSQLVANREFTLPKDEDENIKCVLLDMSQLVEEQAVKNKGAQYIAMKYKCEGCVLGFRSQCLYEAHMKRHSIECKSAKYHVVCDICRCILPHKTAGEHFAEHFIRFQCLLCEKKYTSYEKAKTHIAYSHDRNNLLQCKKCEFTTNSQRSLRYHREKNHMGRRYECNLCSKTVSTQSTLNYHMRAIHKMGPRKTSKCPVCDKSMQVKNLKKHMRTIHENIDSSAFCVECKMQFKSVCSLNQHLKYHKNHVDANKWVFCDYCNKSFTRKASLTMHIHRIHIGDLKFRCNYCDKAYSLAKSLRDHIRHTHLKKAVRSHICDICGKGFTQSAVFKAHTRTHTGERPYKCGICNATFTQSGSLYTHKRLVHSTAHNK